MLSDDIPGAGHLGLAVAVRRGAVASVQALSTGSDGAGRERHGGGEAGLLVLREDLVLAVGLKVHVQRPHHGEGGRGLRWVGWGGDGLERW